MNIARKEKVGQLKTVALTYTHSEVLNHFGLFATPMDRSLPGFSVHGIFQARILEWVAISFSRRSSRPRD